MQLKTLTIQLNDEQLPIFPVEPEAHLSFTTHTDGNELELTGNRAGLLLLAKATLGMAETLRGDGFHIHLADLYGINNEEESAESLLTAIRQRAALPAPHEQSTVTVGWMCWEAHRSCYCRSIINFMTGFWNTIWRRLTRCSLQQKNDCITEKETLLWDLIFTPGR